LQPMGAGSNRSASRATPVTPGTLALRLRGITKHFPGVTALDRVDLDLYRGEVHALVGENGAGKSTLIKILSGVQTADEGDFLVAGNAVLVSRPSEASRLGITVVPQDILMVPEFSIGRNILLGWESGLARRGQLNVDERRTVQAALAKVDAPYAGWLHWHESYLPPVIGVITEWLVTKLLSLP